MFNLKKRLKYALGNKTRLEARDGDYKNVFCPHCAAFIPMNYRVMPNAPAKIEGMTFECPDCGRSGSVMKHMEFGKIVADNESELIQRFKDGEDNE